VTRSLASLLLLFPLLGCCRLGLGRTEPFSAEAYERHIRDKQASFGQGFTVMAAGPFVVIGDGAPEWVAEDARDVVEVAAKRLKERFFPRDPAQIVDVLMLRTESSYDRYAGGFLGAPSTPYGYYSPCDRAIYVNMTLGDGTLVHEMVHAFMDANFPASPTWFNEGLGSLYEHTNLDSGALRGRPNWRLPGLQRAITDKRTLPLADLLATSRSEFYAEKRAGLHYAMARYLLFYLQEKGLLERYYRRFVESHGSDRTGVDALREVLGEKDLTAFQSRWEEAVLAIVYPD